MTTREVAALAALDFACWENSEEYGQGWVRPAAVAYALEVSLVWACQLLGFLVSRGLVERRRLEKVFHYAPTERGAELLMKLEQSAHPAKEKGGGEG